MTVPTPKPDEHPLLKRMTSVHRALLKDLDQYDEGTLKLFENALRTMADHVAVARREREYPWTKTS